jgi:hypothetical protein
MQQPLAIGRSWSRAAFPAVVCALSTVLLLGPVGSVAAAATPSAVTAATVVIGRSTVTGQATAGATLTGDLIGANGRIRATAPEGVASAAGAFTLEFVDLDGLPVPLVSGDRLRLRENGTSTLDAKVPELSVDGNVDSDIVSGTAPAGLEVVVEAYNLLPLQPVSMTVLADAAGRFVAAFAGQFDLTDNSTVRVTVQQAVLTTRLERSLGEQVQVRLYGATVLGLGPTGATVRGTLRGSGAAHKGAGEAAAGFLGFFTIDLLNPVGEPVMVEPGDTLALDFVGLKQLEWRIPELTATPDGTTDIVAGLAPAGSTVAVSAAGTTLSAIAGSDGRYAASFAGSVDLEPGSSGQSVTTVGSNLTVARSWGITRLSLLLGSDTVTGVASAGPPLRLTLVAADGAQLASTTVQPTAGGLFGGGATFSARFVDGAGSGVVVASGQTLRFSRPGEDFAILVPPLSAAVDLPADKVTGTAPPGAQVNVTASTLVFFNQSRQVTAGSDGRWLADFAGSLDLIGGTDVRAQVVLPGGHLATVATTGAALRVWPELGRLDGAVRPGAELAITVSDAAGQPRATATATADFLGQFQAELLGSGGVAYLPRPADRITLRFAAGEASLVVPALAIDWNVAADRVYGEATPGGTVTVSARPPAGRGNNRVTLTVPVSPSGTYDVDFSGQQDLTAGSRLEVTYSYPNGDRSRVDRVLPLVNVQSGGNAVFGYALPRANVVATLNPGDGRGTGQAGADQQFALGVTDSAGQPQVIGDGQVVDVDVGGRFVKVPVGPLSARLTPASRSLSGTGPVSSTLEVRMIPATGQPRRLTVTTDATGAYSRTLPANLNLTGGTSAEVGYATPEGHRVFTVAVVPRLVAYIETADVAGRVDPLSSLTLALTAADGAVQATATAKAASDGQFAAVLSGSGPQLSAGQRLSAVAGSQQVAMTVQDVAVAIDTAANRITGHMPVGAGVQGRFVNVRVYQFGSDTFLNVTVLADTQGAFSLDPANPGLLVPAFSLTSVSRVEAVHTLPEGHQTIATARPVWRIFLPLAHRPRR